MEELDVIEGRKDLEEWLLEGMEGLVDTAGVEEESMEEKEELLAELEALVVDVLAQPQFQSYPQSWFQISHAYPRFQTFQTYLPVEAALKAAADLHSHQHILQIHFRS